MIVDVEKVDNNQFNDAKKGTEDSKGSSRKRGIRKPPLRHTQLYITVSTNLSINHMNADRREELLNNFEQACDEFFGSVLPLQMIELKNSKEETDEYKNIPLIQRFEGAPYLKYGTEIGTKKNIPHCGALFKTSHRALNVKLNYSEIHKWWDDRMGMKIYFYSEPIRNNTGNLEEYIQKGLNDY